MATVMNRTSPINAPPETVPPETVPPESALHVAVSAATVLLVDDNQELRSAAADLLRGHGATVLEADSVAAAEQVWDAHPDVTAVITDVRMPGEDGLVLAERLRVPRPHANRPGPVPILLVSSHLDATLEARLAEGDVAFRRKPFSLDDLLAGLDDAEARARHPTPRPAELRAPARRDARSHRSRWAPVIVSFAAVLAVTVGLGIMGLLTGGLGMQATNSSPPPLPDVDPTSQRRSFRVEPLAPRGRQDMPPQMLDWRPVDGVTVYRLTVRRPGDEIVWQGEVVQPPAALPDSVVGGLDEAVHYHWRVDAIDVEGKKIAWSESARFWLEPKTTSDMKRENP